MPYYRNNMILGMQEIKVKYPGFLSGFLASPKYKALKTLNNLNLILSRCKMDLIMVSALSTLLDYS